MAANRDRISKICLRLCVIRAQTIRTEPIMTHQSLPVYDLITDLYGLANFRDLLFICLLMIF